MITTVRLDTRAATGCRVGRFPVRSTLSSVPEGRRGHMPLSIPASQRYFWTAHWQQGEAESRRDQENGEVRRFADPSDAIRWLLSDD